MTETRVARVTGIGALACVALSWLQFPLWVIGEPPSMYDGAGFARHLFDIRTMALLRILMDQGIYVGMMVFAAGFRHLVRHARPESEWLGTLTFGAAAVWLAVTLVADGLMGGAVLDTLRGDADASGAVSDEHEIVFKGERLPTRIYDRAKLAPGNRFGGPAIVTEFDSTTVVTIAAW